MHKHCGQTWPQTSSAHSLVWKSDKKINETNDYRYCDIMRGIATKDAKKKDI